MNILKIELISVECVADFVDGSLSVSYGDEISLDNAEENVEENIEEIVEVEE